MKTKKTDRKIVLNRTAADESVNPVNRIQLRTGGNLAVGREGLTRRVSLSVGLSIGPKVFLFFLNDRPIPCAIHKWKIIKIKFIYQMI